MQDSERRELAAAIADELANRRQLAGFLLVDVENARRQLQEVDELLMRVKRAIIDQASAEADNG
jgi:hypothetical protein